MLFRTYVAECVAGPDKGKYFEFIEKVFDDNGKPKSVTDVVGEVPKPKRKF